MAGQIFKTFAFAFLLMVSYRSGAQQAGLPKSDLFGRKYKIGETYRYRLTMDESHNGAWDHTNIAVC